MHFGISRLTGFVSEYFLLLPVLAIQHKCNVRGPENGLQYLPGHDGISLYVTR